MSFKFVWPILLNFFGKIKLFMASCLFQIFFHLYLFNVRLRNRGVLPHLSEACLFHLCQSVHRAVIGTGNKTRYETDRKFSTGIRSLCALAFLFYFWWKSVKIFGFAFGGKLSSQEAISPRSYQIWGCHLQAIPVCGCDLRSYQICGCHLQAVPYLPSFTSGSFRHTWNITAYINVIFFIASAC